MLSDETMLHGMRKVRGSNPLSSTVFRIRVREKVTICCHWIMA